MIAFCIAHVSGVAPDIAIKLKMPETGTAQFIHSLAIPLSDAHKRYAKKVDWKFLYGIEERVHPKFDCNDCKFRMHCIVDPDSKRLFEPR